MTVTPEIEKPTIQGQENGKKEVSDEKIEVTPSLQGQGIVSTQFPVKTQVGDDKQAAPIQIPTPKVITITIPASGEQLEDWSKGSPDESLTWFAFFWLRMIKKAIHFGWRIITKGGK